MTRALSHLLRSQDPSNDAAATGTQRPGSFAGAVRTAPASQRYRVSKVLCRKGNHKVWCRLCGMSRAPVTFRGPNACVHCARSVRISHRSKRPKSVVCGKACRQALYAPPPKTAASLRRDTLFQPRRSNAPYCGARGKLSAYTEGVKSTASGLALDAPLAVAPGHPGQPFWAPVARLTSSATRALVASTPERLAPGRGRFSPAANAGYLRNAGQTRALFGKTGKLMSAATSSWPRLSRPRNARTHRRDRDRRDQSRRARRRRRASLLARFGVNSSISRKSQRSRKPTS